MHITKATLSFDLPTAQDVDVSVTSFATDGTGQLGFMWNPTGPGTETTVAHVSSAMEIDVTDLLQNRIAQNQNWFGLYLKANSGNMIKFLQNIRTRQLDPGLARVNLRRRVRQ